MSYLVRQAADRNFDHETDVAIVGTGAAGLSAALRASSEGAEVLLLEKAPTVGGTTFKAHGFAWFPDNYWMREQGLDDPKRDAIAYMARLSGPEAFDAEDATFGLPRDRYELLEAFYDNAGPAVAAAVEAGVRYIPAETLPDYYAHLPQNKAPVGRCFMPADDDGELGWGNNTVEQLLRASEQRGAKLLAGHRVIRLVLDAAGGVCGLIAEADGREVAVRARRGVVFASGGFGQSPELRRALLAGPTFGACAAHSNTGDFLEMATELGLPIRNTNWAWLTPMVLERGLRNDPRHETTFAPPGDSMIYVNRYGRRTMDEKAPYNETVQNMWRWDSQKLEWPDLLQFMIWDQECQDRYHSDVPANPIATTGIDDGHVVRGETLPELVLALRARVEQLEPQTHITLDEGFGQELEKSIARFNEISDKFAEPMDEEQMNKLLEEQAKLQDAIDAAGGWELERKLEIAADALRLPPWEAKIDQLSGGEKRRVALCRLLLSQPDMLLLDEPTNHLDAESVAWLERHLEEYPGTVVAVTHDRYFLDNVAGWILELDRGHGIPWQGNYSSWLEQKERRLAQEEKQQEALRKTLERELEWVRQNPKARQAKSKARIKQFEELSSVEFQKRNETNEIYIPPGPRLGDSVIEVTGLRKGFGDRLLIDGLGFSLPKGGIVGIIGPNGAGKTTLFRMLAGQEQPDDGEIRVGPTVQLAYVDQSRDTLDGDKTVWEEISGGLDMIRVGSYETASRGYVGRFNFRGTQQQQHIRELSGGERNRVHLAKILKSGANVLLLDEPTNDLDVETLRALEEALLTFPGCAVVISHDRWFLDRVATHILAFEGNSEVVWFEGNFADYVQDLRRRKGDDADQPHRIRFKPLHG